ncbi:hypothetical protein CEXT_647581 [Caerostris extrusa]|uniref:Uncharacterized protein n=1 Tax=Caerostris extrusa TaxID=172846 RepID=A0AAV4XZJ2_CAEEX|nr:hypothetical protein CEXT_647581 [Caerostris extrusa]
MWLEHLADARTMPVRGIVGCSEVKTDESRSGRISRTCVQKHLIFLSQYEGANSLPVICHSCMSLTESIKIPDSLIPLRRAVSSNLELIRSRSSPRLFSRGHIHQWDVP